MKKERLCPCRGLFLGLVPPAGQDGPKDPQEGLLELILNVVARIDGDVVLPDPDRILDLFIGLLARRRGEGLAKTTDYPHTLAPLVPPTMT